MLDAKRSVSVCLIPKSNELELPRTHAEERREKKKDEHNSFRKDLGILLEILGDQVDSTSKDPLETRILSKVRELKGILMKTQEERDVLRNNNQEMESKLAQLLKGLSNGGGPLNNSNNHLHCRQFRPTSGNQKEEQ